MPTVPFTTQARVQRFKDQRWLIDKIVELAGPEFDQTRLHYYAAPMSSDWAGGVMGLAGQIKRYDDMPREFARLARRYELQAMAADSQGHHVTASDGFFAASVMYGAAQWPIFENTDLNYALERKKTECYQAAPTERSGGIGAHGPDAAPATSGAPPPCPVHRRT